MLGGGPEGVGRHVCPAVAAGCLRMSSEAEAPKQPVGSQIISYFTVMSADSKKVEGSIPARSAWHPVQVKPML